MTQGGEEGNRDLKILCCYYRMRSASTGVGNWIGMRHESQSSGGKRDHKSSEVRIMKSEKRNRPAFPGWEGRLAECRVLFN